MGLRDIRTSLQPKSVKNNISIFISLVKKMFLLKNLFLFYHIIMKIFLKFVMRISKNL